MIHDTLENFSLYLPLHPRFAKVAEFLRATDLRALPQGRVDILPGGEIYANVQRPRSRAPEATPLEYHRKYIDVQIPLEEAEVMGWLPLAKAPASLVYNPDTDAALGTASHTSRPTVLPGEFTIFFPQDAHAPCIGDGREMSKIIIKVLAD
ncbi:MAG: YhcH/YjgK/YiaL family protein [Oligosphaeraceae bacterium]